MTKSEKNQLHAALRESYLDRVNERSALKYLAQKAAERAENKSKIDTIKRWAALSIAWAFVAVTLLLVVFK